MPTLWPCCHGLTFIHPYDDLAVIAGQGTMALECWRTRPDLDAWSSRPAAAGW
jgi:threonine dehydratase